jgi:DNA-directed RNA polymerase specialized sigma24 family protein
MQIATDEKAGEFITPLYDELRKLAHARVRRMRPGETLQTTDLVHEAYVRLSKNREYEWQNPRHFFGAAAVAMRDVLVDRARYRGARKHGGDQVRVEPTARGHPTVNRISGASRISRACPPAPAIPSALTGTSARTKSFVQRLNRASRERLPSVRRLNSLKRKRSVSIFYSSLSKRDGNRSCRGSIH